MTESDLKRCLIKSIYAQGGLGHRFEDKYAVGWPDLLLIPATGPVFFAEVKLIKIVRDPRLKVTPTQGMHLDRLAREPYQGRYFCFGCVIGYSTHQEALFIGRPDMPLRDCRFIPRPRRLDSGEWEITELLRKYYHDYQRGIGRKKGLRVRELVDRQF